MAKDNCDNFDRPWGIRDWDRLTAGAVFGAALAWWWLGRKHSEELERLAAACGGRASGAVRPAMKGSIAQQLLAQRDQTKAPPAVSQIDVAGTAMAQPSAPAAMQIGMEGVAAVLPRAPVSAPLPAVRHLDLKALYAANSALWRELQSYQTDARVFELSGSPRPFVSGLVLYRNRHSDRVLRNQALPFVSFETFLVGDSNDPGALLQTREGTMAIRTDSDAAVSALRRWMDNRVELAYQLSA